MKYIIKGTDLLYNGEHYPEGSEVELSDKEAKKLSSMLEPVKEEPKKGGSK
ncbi:MAG: hypothetical protein M1510_10610 [Nitrospirae bacterium]|nr:hypothetical protein [Nitrospirota bacterium]MCL5237414.1 hypothetical protein [Nitrospirota bacterium]